MSLYRHDMTGNNYTSTAFNLKHQKIVKQRPKAAMAFVHNMTKTNQANLKKTESRIKLK